MSTVSDVDVEDCTVPSTFHAIVALLLAGANSEKEKVCRVPWFTATVVLAGIGFSIAETVL